MKRSRRILIVGGLALVVGVLSGADVERRERELEHELSPVVDVVVATRDLPRAQSIADADVSIRSVPMRYAPVAGVGRARAVVGRRTVRDLHKGEYLTTTALEPTPSESAALLQTGERAVEIIAVGSPQLVLPGVTVDVLITRQRGDGSPGRAELALQGVEVLFAHAVGEGSSGDEAARVAATLRVNARQAMYLSAAEAAANRIRLLPRASGDRERLSSSTAAGGGGGR